MKALTDEAITEHIAQAAKAPSPLCLMHLYPIDGAVHRMGKSDPAWPTRNASYSMVIAGIHPDPSAADSLKTWGRVSPGAPNPHAPRVAINRNGGIALEMAPSPQPTVDFLESGA